MRIIIVYGSTIYSASRLPKQINIGLTTVGECLVKDVLNVPFEIWWGRASSPRSENKTYPLLNWVTKGVAPANAGQP